MAKLDLDLIFSNGHGRPVPKEMDRHMVKYIIGQRKEAIKEDPSLFATERWDHSDVFYAIRTHLNQYGYDTSVYNDYVGGGSDRRKSLYDMIKPVCEEYYHVKRHQIGIYPEDRAIMAFRGRVYSVGFGDLRALMQNGTDVIVVEKQGTVIKMVPFTGNMGIAFIQSQGFVSEYGTALAALCTGEDKTAFDYTDNYVPKYKGHLGVLTDCDSSGIMIGLKIKNATRIGIDLNTIIEMNQVNEDLGIDLDLTIEDLQEATSVNSHWTALDGVLRNTGKVYQDLSTYERRFYRDYLSQYYDINGDNIQFIEYLEENRIELNTILAAAKPEPFWNWLRWKLLQLWPSRDYRRGGIYIANKMRTPMFNRFEKWYLKQTEPIIRDSVAKANNALSTVEGFFEDVDIKQEEIETDIRDNILLKDEGIQEIDLALESIMSNNNEND
jgi:hypothetical protein